MNEPKPEYDENAVYDMTLKYEPVSLSKVDSILSLYKGQQVLDYIKDLYRLIEYQKKRLFAQEKEIIAFKHEKAWKHYDKS